MENGDFNGLHKNYLTVIREERDKAHRRIFVCRCDCGNIKRIQYQNVLSGKVKSCGCKHDKLCSEAAKRHGGTGTRLYRIWRGMIARCYYPASDNYKNYGGRGVFVCDEWRHNYESFREWALSHGYADNLTIDRMNVNGNYEPSNCRWATYHEQNLNRRPMRKKTWNIDGIEKPRTEWCKEYGKSIQCVMYRVSKMGMTPKEALEA